MTGQKKSDSAQIPKTLIQFRTIKTDKRQPIEIIKPSFQLSKIDWSIDGRDKRKVLYGQNMSGMFTIIKRKSIKPGMRNISFMKNTFNFDIGKPAFRSKNTFYYLVDIEHGQLNFIEAKAVITPEMAALILKKSIVKQLVSGLESSPMGSTILLIIAFSLAALAGGYILGNFVPFG